MQKTWFTASSVQKTQNSALHGGLSDVNGLLMPWWPVSGRPGLFTAMRREEGPGCNPGFLPALEGAGARR